MVSIANLKSARLTVILVAVTH